MGEEIFGRDSTIIDAVEREDRISKEAKHKTIVDEMREVRDAVELKDYELAEQRIDSLQMHLQTQPMSLRRYRIACYRHFLELSARERGFFSDEALVRLWNFHAIKFSDRRGMAMADEP